MEKEIKDYINEIINDFNGILLDLDQRKTELCIIDVSANPYCIKNFGDFDFYSNSLSLIDDIFQNIYDNKIVLLKTHYGNWYIREYFEEKNDLFRGIIFESVQSNFNQLLKFLPNNNIDDFILNNLDTNIKLCILLQDQHTDPPMNYIKFFKTNFLTQHNLINYIDSIIKEKEK